jgi:hypothetical protein
MGLGGRDETDPERPVNRRRLKLEQFVSNGSKREQKVESIDRFPMPVYPPVVNPVPGTPASFFGDSYAPLDNTACHERIASLDVVFQGVYGQDDGSRKSGAPVLEREISSVLESLSKAGIRETDSFQDLREFG